MFTSQWKFDWNNVKASTPWPSMHNQGEGSDKNWGTLIEGWKLHHVPTNTTRGWRNIEEYKLHKWFKDQGKNASVHWKNWHPCVSPWLEGEVQCMKNSSRSTNALLIQTCPNYSKFSIWLSMETKNAERGCDPKLINFHIKIKRS